MESEKQLKVGESAEFVYRFIAIDDGITRGSLLNHSHKLTLKKTKLGYRILTLDGCEYTTTRFLHGGVWASKLLDNSQVGGIKNFGKYARYFICSPEDEERLAKIAIKHVKEKVERDYLEAKNLYDKMKSFEENT